jgi:hypothetical protein
MCIITKILNILNFTVLQYNTVCRSAKVVAYLLWSDDTDNFSWLPKNAILH